MSAVLKVSLLGLEYRHRWIFQDLSFEVGSGAFVSILGPSGIGKSTLLRVLAGLENPSVGQVSWNLDFLNRFAFVFQDPRLIPWLTVVENVQLQSLLGAGSPADLKDHAVELLKLVSLEERFWNFYPKDLSGGMKMRVSLARALYSKPKALFLDEPFSALDEILREDLMTLIQKLCGERQMNCFLVTHSFAEAFAASDQALLLGKKEGRVSLLLSQLLTTEEQRDAAQKDFRHLQRSERA